MLIGAADTVPLTHGLWRGVQLTHPRGRIGAYEALRRQEDRCRVAAHLPSVGSPLTSIRTGCYSSDAVPRFSETVEQRESWAADAVAKLVANNVRKVFPPRVRGQEPVLAISNVSFEMEGHTFVSLVGPSGCGKSTFLNLVSGVELPTSGTLELVGEGSADVKIGYVFQDPRLLPWKSVLDNILYVQDGDRRERAERAHRYLELVGLQDSESQYPGQLSGGMQQRVGIARALSIDPGLLLMDEPFSHLDAITARTMREELQRLWQTTGAGILFVTHDVLEAVLLSNRVLMMSSAGEIYRDITIDLPYPRLQTDHDVVTLQADILELFELMEAESVSRRKETVPAEAAAPS
jgi:NitT/TauT family transport system ATP-binding protein